MNRPDEDSTAREAGQDAGSTPDDDEDPGGHLGNPANLESGAPVVDDYDDDEPSPTS